MHPSDAVFVHGVTTLLFSQNRSISLSDQSHYTPYRYTGQPVNAYFFGKIVKGAEICVEWFCFSTGCRTSFVTLNAGVCHGGRIRKRADPAPGDKKMSGICAEICPEAKHAADVSRSPKLKSAGFPLHRQCPGLILFCYSCL